MSRPPLCRNIETPTHGRCLIVPAQASRPSGTLVAFHGYAQSADWMLDRLREAASIEQQWQLCAVQALHRFYQAGTGLIVASWMTSQDRGAMIEDNLAYVGRVLDELDASVGSAHPVVFVGFSQGAAMAWRAAQRFRESTRAIVAVGGDVPPELSADAFSEWSGNIFIARGQDDRIYSARQMQTDAARFHFSADRMQCAEYPGGHEWNADTGNLLAAFLEKLR